MRISAPFSIDFDPAVVADYWGVAARLEKTLEDAQSSWTPSSATCTESPAGRCCKR